MTPLRAERNDTRLQFAAAAYAREIGFGQRIFNDKLLAEPL